MDRKEELKNTKCPIELTQKVINGKWKIVIIWTLKDGVKRFGELQRELPFIKRAYLTRQLRELEMDGLILREVYPQVPPKVEYSLTDVGKGFLKVLQKMYEWGLEYMEFLKKG